MSIVFVLIAAAALGYFVVLGLYVGFMTATALAWCVGAALSAVCGLLWRIIKKQGGFSRLSLFTRTFLITTAILFFAVFLLVEAFIVSGMRSTPEENADYIIVPGARVIGTYPSESLRLRLDAAAAYAREYPYAKIIVSGAQGADEAVSEAQAMYRYLVDHGISASRIIRETESRTTAENIRNSLSYVLDGERVVIVSNDYHVARAAAMARHMRPGIGVSCCAAKNPAPLIVHSMLREALAVMKARLMGQM